MTRPVVTNRSAAGPDDGVWYQTATPGGVAQRLAAALSPFIGGDLPVRLRAWDGSEAGPPDGPLVELRTPDAVRRLLWHPGELGAAQAYVTGELEVHETGGWDLDRALTHVFAVARERGLARTGGTGSGPPPPPSRGRCARPRASASSGARRPPRRRRRTSGGACTARCATAARSATTTTSPTSSTR